VRCTTPQSRDRWCEARANRALTRYDAGHRAGEPGHRHPPAIGRNLIQAGLDLTGDVRVDRRPRSQIAAWRIGSLRLLTGMVRANRPGRALLGLSKLLVGVFGTAAVSLINSTIWQVGDALDGLRPAQDSLIVPRDQCGDDFVWQRARMSVRSWCCSWLSWLHRRSRPLPRYRLARGPATGC
jgi:hypothetical protein